MIDYRLNRQPTPQEVSQLKGTLGISHNRDTNAVSADTTGYLTERQRNALLRAGLISLLQRGEWE